MAVAMMMLASCAPLRPAATVDDTRTQGAALATACAGRDGWSDPAPPARIHGGTYYVGTCGITVLLVTSPQGHVLIDGATAAAVPSILANIRSLGFDPRDIRFIVGSHEHLDHMGGFALLKVATGARLLVSQAARAVVETGRTDPADPQAGAIPDMAPVAVDGVVSFGPQYADVMVATPTSVLGLTPHPTPGHTIGGTSWTWRSCEGRNCVTFAYVDSLSAVSADGYRFTNHPERIAPFRATFARVAALPCGVLITPHPGASATFARLAGRAPLINAEACRTLAASARERLDTRLTQETMP